MTDKPNEKEPNIYRVDTVPPPAGGTAYDAPTKVGPMLHTVLDAMKKAAEDGTPLKPQSLPAQARTPEELDAAVLQDAEFPRLDANREGMNADAETKAYETLGTKAPPSTAPTVPIAHIARAPRAQTQPPLPGWTIVVVVVSLLVAAGSLATLLLR